MKSIARNLGLWFDRNLDMSFHRSKQCDSAFYHLQNISRIRWFLSTDTTKALVHAFVTSCVGYCNNLLYGLPASHLNEVQRVLNALSKTSLSRTTLLSHNAVDVQAALATS